MAESNPDKNPESNLDKNAEPVSSAASSPDELIKDLDAKLSEEEQSKVVGGWHIQKLG